MTCAASAGTAIGCIAAGFCATDNLATGHSLTAPEAIRPKESVKSPYEKIVIGQKYA